MEICLIVARSANKVIGVNNKIPWDLRPDMEYFKNKTVGNAVLMGYNTMKSIGKPLKNRINIVLADFNKHQHGFHFFNDINKTISFAKKARVQKLFIIGGENTYKKYIDVVEKIYLTEINIDIHGDSFFNIDLSKWYVSDSEKGNYNNIQYSFNTLIKN